MHVWFDHTIYQSNGVKYHICTMTFGDSQHLFLPPRFRVVDTVISPAIVLCNVKLL